MGGIYSIVSILISMEIIETIYYDQKTLWPFHSYTAQNCKGIEILVNLVSISYYTIKFLPYQNEHFLNTAKKRTDISLELSQSICSQIFWSLSPTCQNTYKVKCYDKTLKQLFRQLVYYYKVLNLCYFIKTSKRIFSFTVM